MIKVLVVGLDGATWSFLKPWADQGELPTFRKLMKEGSWGELESSIPPVSLPAWKCYSTGKNPGKLGVYWWLKADFQKKRLEPNNSRSFQSPELWDYLGEAGIKVGVINMPGTFPPKKVNGFMICGCLANNKGYTYPYGLGHYLEKKYNYRINPKYFIDFFGIKALKDVEETIFNKFPATKEIIEKVDFTHFTVFYIDDIQHFFWDDKKIIQNFYEKIDKELASLIEMVDITFLISDHGFTALKKTFFINAWLKKQGVLTTSTQNRILARARMNYSRLVVLANEFKIASLFRKFPTKIQRKIDGKIRSFAQSRIGHMEHRSFEGNIDWERTQAFALGEGPIYIDKDKFADSKAYHAFRDQLIRELISLTTPSDDETHERVMEEVLKGEAVYSGKYLKSAPDIVVLPAKGYEIKMDLTRENIIWSPDTSWQNGFLWQGTHTSNGIFLAYGKGIKKGNAIEGARIYDVAPTILHIYGLPIPNDLDGRVLREIFEEDSEYSKTPIEHRNADAHTTAEEMKRVLSKTEEEKVKERLRRLGYI